MLPSVNSIQDLGFIDACFFEPLYSLLTPTSSSFLVRKNLSFFKYSKKSTINLYVSIPENRHKIPCLNSKHKKIRIFKLKNDPYTHTNMISAISLWNTFWALRVQLQVESSSE